jgi:hypothetical protein
MVLQFGRQRLVEIVGNIGDSEKVLRKPALFPGRLARDQLCFRFARFGDDDLSPAAARSTRLKRFVFAS